MGGTLQQLLHRSWEDGLIDDYEVMSDGSVQVILGANLLEYSFVDAHTQLRDLIEHIYSYQASLKSEKDQDECNR